MSDFNVGNICMEAQGFKWRKQLLKRTLLSTVSVVLIRRMRPLIVELVLARNLFCPVKRSEGHHKRKENCDATANYSCGVVVRRWRWILWLLQVGDRRGPWDCRNGSANPIGRLYARGGTLNRSRRAGAVRQNKINKWESIARGASRCASFQD